MTLNLNAEIFCDFRDSKRTFSTMFSNFNLSLFILFSIALILPSLQCSNILKTRLGTLFNWKKIDSRGERCAVATETEGYLLLLSKA